MPDLASRAREALAARLRELLPADALHPAGTHALRFADALVPTLGPGDVSWAHAQLAARARGELRPTRAGAIPAHAAWSSTALVCSALAPWRGAPQRLALADLGPFDEIRLEERLMIPHGGGTPNLDAALAGGSALVGVEPSSPSTWRLPRPAGGAPRTTGRPWPPSSRAGGRTSSPTS